MTVSKDEFVLILQAALEILTGETAETETVKPKTTGRGRPRKKVEPEPEVVATEPEPVVLLSHGEIQAKISEAIILGSLPIQKVLDECGLAKISSMAELKDLTVEKANLFYTRVMENA